MNIKKFFFKEDSQIEENKPASSYENVTQHLQRLKEKAEQQANKFNNTLDFIDSLTETAQLKEYALEKERDIWKATFDSITSFIILLDPNYKITRVNKSFISYIGVDEKFIIGRDCKDILGNKFCNCMKSCPVKSHELSCHDDFYTTELDNGNYFTMSYSPVLNSNNQLNGYVLLIYDITERVESQKSMQIRSDILTAINITTEKMLRDFKPTNGTRVQEMISEIGKAAQVSAVFIFRADNENDKIVSQDHKWINQNIDNIEPVEDYKIINLDLTQSGFIRWYNAFKSNNIIHGHVEDFPEEEQLLLFSRKIQSILVVPYFIHGKYAGFIGFDECTKKRVWQEPEINALKMAANILSAWIERGKVETFLKDIIEENDSNNKKIGEYLIEEGYITKEQLQEAINKQKTDDSNIQRKNDKVRYYCVTVND